MGCVFSGTTGSDTPMRPLRDDDTPTVSPPAGQEDLLLMTSGHHGGLFSTRPAPKKIKVTSGEAIVAACSFNPYSLSDLSDLTELEEQESRLGLDSQPATKKRRR